MKTTIFIHDDIADMVPDALKNLPNIIYKVQKIKSLDDNKRRNIAPGESFVGKIKVLPFSNKTPYLIVGAFPYGGMHTSNITDTREFDLLDEEYKKYTTKLIIKTQNSEYAILGPFEVSDE